MAIGTSRPRLAPLTPTLERGDALSVREAFAAGLRQQQTAARRERMSFWDWSLGVPEPKTGRLDFERFPFQPELYRDEGAGVKDMVIVKGTQIGVSAWLLRFALYWADMRALSALYLMPKTKQLYDFGDARVRAVIRKSSYLMSRVPREHTQNKGLKQIGGGWVYFRGSDSIHDLESADIDVLCMDEYNRLAPNNIPVVERRTSGSLLGLIRRVGVPTLPKYGLDPLYEDSDRRRWMVRCGKGHDTPMRWADAVDTERMVRRCKTCEVELRPQDVAGGRWVAERPGVDRRGYHIPKIVQPEANIPLLVRRSQQSDPAELKAFWNFDAAESWAEAEGRLDPDTIAAAMSFGESLGSTAKAPGYVGNDLITMGVDVASVRRINVRVSRHVSGDRKVSLFCGTVEDFNEVEALMNRYGVHMACLDHLPDGRLARAVCERFPGRAYTVSYGTPQQKEVLKADMERRHVSVRRVEAIDAMMEAIRTMRNALPFDAPPRYAQNLQNLMRVSEKDNLGRRVVRYESTGEDDFAHAEVYDLTAEELYHEVRMTDELRRPQMTRLEDHVEYERSALHEDSEVYEPGVGDPDETYSAGFDDGLG